MTTKRIALVASSDIKIRELVRTSLLSEGLEPVLCGDGIEVMESVKSQEISHSPVELIILEAFLPKIDGFEIVKQLENSSATQEIPILMLTDQEKGQPRINISIRFGADDYLEKPFELEEVQQKIHSMVRHHRPHRALHPLTGLGGHPQLELELLNCFNRGENFVTLWMDINHFRPFNDHYGKEQGDEVIKMFVRMIQDALKSLQIPVEQAPFLAHVDGDDFILLISVDKANQVREWLRNQFRTETQKFYSEEERKQGFFYEKNRSQKDQIFPLMNLSMVLLETTMEMPFHYGKFISKANELLRQSKIGSQDAK